MGLVKRIKESKIGRACWFNHPEDGRVVQGIYQRGRKVRELTGVRREQAEGGGRIYDFDETIWTVPTNIPIHFGVAPPSAHYQGTRAQ